ncbi:MAG: tRNA (adenosine(37)-N6)-threonylcarbamoyltransferase complex dimerization subunit type 1 TsaB [Saprospiraceae bacterium]
MSTYLLCIESSTEICSVAIFEEETLISFVEELNSNRHAEILAPLVAQCMKNANITYDDLSAVAVSNGPGSYTSLRVGLSTVKGICFAKSKPLIAIPSDVILVEGNKTKAVQENCSHIIAMIDARRMEAYCSVFSLLEETTTDCQPVIFTENQFEELQKEASLIGLCGNGSPKFYVEANKTIFKLLSKETSARFMGIPALKRYQQSIFDDVAYTTPIYVKPPNITLSKKNTFL